ncbi:amino acid permease [Gracilimonas mengyeensis]|uniref:Amino acid/polyamine/organocation transporter, APC superfamily n=1 Tax=Gracilimonas mengyeensis TaxID=1302730 RepID=A0A521DFB6_9BACT|nr:amino acid permease [Gracilimonas mengyeensis]SMO69640.1 amino acid/polyamine/organocation transporter, APC superfamily [Gracilimonas mengyeensis]
MTDLKRELGFWDALTIGAGTMIGAGIFLLAGVALEMSGPAAIFAYLIAGVVCMITASSAAELATGMPTSGGDYFFVSRSLGPALGAISGVGIWLSLTFAIAFYLYGLGEYLSQFLPITAFWGAVIGGILLTILNVVGAKESGRTQVIVVLVLFVILGSFSFLGVFHIDSANYDPFMPFGFDSISATTALVFVSFLGFVKIAAVAEEIKDPSKNLPRALIGSVALVTLLYVVIVLVIGGMFEQSTIADVRDPLTTAARTILGSPGAVAIIIAGLLATLSSANASIMASSRINLAMARDRMVPNWLSAIHDKLLTPYRAIILTGVLALFFLLLESLEDLAKIASVLQLYSYAALNIGCVALRVANPDWYKPTYRTPGTPWLQIIAALGCLSIIVYSGPFAQIAVVVLIIASLAWYFVWGRNRVEIDHALPQLAENWKEQGFGALVAAPQKHESEFEEWTPAIRALNASEPRKVMAALANPVHEKALLKIAQLIATGDEEGGSVTGLNMVKVPYQTPVSTVEQILEDKEPVRESIKSISEASRAEKQQEVHSESLLATTFDSATAASHDIFKGLMSETENRKADMMVMGWQGGFSLGRIYNSPVQRIIKNLKADVAVLKDRNLDEIKSVVVPWGGGLHARLGLEIGIRVARAVEADLRVLRLVKPGIDAEEEKEALSQRIRPLTENFDRWEITVKEAEDVTGGMLEDLETHKDDLIIIGASHEWGIRNVLFGTITDIIADRAPCSVLMVRRYVTEDWKLKAAEGMKRMREQLGMSSSPETGN